MHFKSSDLNQLTPEYVARLSKARVDELVEVLRNDLLAAQDLLNRDSSNSSSSPSSNKPWNRTSNSSKSMEEAALVAEIEGESDASKGSAEVQFAANPIHNPSNPGKEILAQKKPGKQKGAKGFGRNEGANLSRTCS